MSRTRSLGHVQTIRLAKGTQPIPREDPAPQVVPQGFPRAKEARSPFPARDRSPSVVVEKIVQIVVEPRVVQVLVLPETAAVTAALPSPGRARRITDAYQAADEPPRKVHVIA